MYRRASLVFDPVPFAYFYVLIQMFVFFALNKEVLTAMSSDRMDNAENGNNF